ncbi:RNA polymerase sigma factor [Amycolatopsis eburnea]
MVLTGNRDEAGDVVHDTLLKLVRHVGRGDIEHLGAYARRTLFRVFLRHRDRTRREPPVPEIPRAGADATEAWAGRSDMLTLLLRLPPRTRAVLAPGSTSISVKRTPRGCSAAAPARSSRPPRVACSGYASCGKPNHGPRRPRRRRRRRDDDEPAPTGLRHTLADRARGRLPTPPRGR